MASIQVLIVDDSEDIQGLVGEVLVRYIEDGKIKLYQALTIQDAERIISKKPPLDLILMDACVPGYTPNTAGLIKTAKNILPHCPIIAISSIDGHSNTLIEAGCGGKCKKDIAAIELKILSLLCS